MLTPQIISEILDDRQGAEITFQSILKGYENKFTDKCVYPELRSLIKMDRFFESVLSIQKEAKTDFGRRGHTKLDFSRLNKLLEKEGLAVTGVDGREQVIFSFSEWALRTMSPTLRAGQAVVKKVVDNTTFSTVIDGSSRGRSGFLLIPRPSQKESHRKAVFFYKKKKVGSEVWIEAKAKGFVSASRPRLAWNTFLGEDTSGDVWASDKAVILVETKPFPLQETVMPIVKDKLIQFITAKKFCGDPHHKMISST